jgi:hypothetical protein
MLQFWIENSIDTFSGDESNCYFQGDGDARIETEELAAGIPHDALTDGAKKKSDQLYLYQLGNLMTQKESGNYLVSESEQVQEVQLVNIKNNINGVTSGMFHSFFS